MAEKRSSYKYAVIVAGVLCGILLSSLVYSAVTYQSMLEDKDLQIADYVSQISELQTSLNGNISELLILTNQISLKDSHISDLQTALDGNMSALSSLNSQIQELRSNISSLSSQLVDLQNQISSKNSQIGTLQTALDGNISEISKLNNQIGTLNSNLSRLNSQVSDLQNQLSTKNYQIRLFPSVLISNLTTVLIAQKSTVWVDNQTINLPVGSSINYTFSASYLGYITVQFQAKDYSSVSTSVLMDFEGQTLGQGASVDVSGTAYMPIFPSSNIRIIIQSLTTEVNKTVTIIYHY